MVKWVNLAREGKLPLPGSIIREKTQEFTYFDHKAAQVSADKCRQV